MNGRRVCLYTADREGIIFVGFGQRKERTGKETKVEVEVEVEVEESEASVGVGFEIEGELN